MAIVDAFGMMVLMVWRLCGGVCGKKSCVRCNFWFDGSKRWRWGGPCFAFGRKLDLHCQSSGASVCLHGSTGGHALLLFLLVLPRRASRSLFYLRVCNGFCPGTGLIYVLLSVSYCIICFLA